MIKRSTLVMCVIFAFICGLYGGFTIENYYSGLNAGQQTNMRGDAPQQAREAAAPKKDPKSDPHFQSMQQALKDNPQDPEAWNHIGHWYFDNNMPADAIKAYETSLAIKPGDPDIITDMGLMYLELNDAQKALELFRKATEADPQHLQSRFNTGVVLYSTNQHKEAIQVWSGLLQIAPAYTMPDGSSLAAMVNELKKTH